MAAEFHEARWWRHEAEGRILCELCPHGCRLKEEQSGFCRVRRREGDRLLSLSYAHPTGFAADPIEKKPLFHFLPGSTSLSFGTLGCTLGCRFCQNWMHSHAEVLRAARRRVAPEEVVALAEREGAASISYTYNEPTVFGEFVCDVSRMARERGIRNVLVSNGYVNPAPRSEIYARIDAVNVDLKAFSDEFYRREAKGRLQPVLDTLVWLRRETQVWIEITTLLIPGLNDSAEMLTEECRWLVDELGPQVPVHFTAFHPDFQMLDREATPPATLARAHAIAREAGLQHVYVGNVNDAERQTTFCTQCGARLIERSWRAVHIVGLEGSRCVQCSQPLAGVFDPPAEA
ncbi:MAG: AmmeMemoRadiSam system radical SAM enzyme [Candidatus Eisenbacteria bacterium]|nr:AmmeMemoRadiSam system radical SAM enzyme [Candidatus Eisenbacteria bacterium]